MIGKIAFGLVIVAAIVLLTPFAQASPEVVIENVSIQSGKVYYDGISYECAIDLENKGNENVTVFIRVEVDRIEIVNTEVNLSVEYFKGFRIKTHKSIYFEVPCEEGIYELRTFVSVGYRGSVTSRPYEAYGCVEEEEEAEDEVEVYVEDLFECP